MGEKHGRPVVYVKSQIIRTVLSFKENNRSRSCSSDSGRGRCCSGSGNNILHEAIGTAQCAPILNRGNRTRQQNPA